MFKKISVLLLGIILVLSVNGCSSGEEYTLPDLEGMTSEEVTAAIAESPVTFVLEYEDTTTVDDGLFVRYSDDLSNGDIVRSNKNITIYIANNKITLPDLSGLSKASLITALDNLGLEYQYVYETDTSLTEDTFIRYANDLVAGNSVPNTDVVEVVISTHMNVLPDLTGLTQLEIYVALNEVGLSATYEVVNDNTVEDQTFSSYGDGLTAGDLVPSNYDVVVNIGYNSEILPDLTGYVKKQINLELDAAGITFNYEYIINDDYPEDTFAGYKNQEIGDFYESEVTVQIYKNTFTDFETSLIISKYIDGGDGTNDQAIEIYNPTDSSINLGDYYLAIFSNGSFEESYHIDFDEIDLASGETYIIGNWSANGNLLVKADLSTTDLVFDGNDTIQLCYKNGTFIDTIYNLGDKDFTMDNEIFVRYAEVVKGTREFNFTEWSGFVPDYYDIVGTHPVTIPTEMTFQFISRGFFDGLGGMNLVTLAYINDGDTAAFNPGFTDGDRVRFLGVDTPETYPDVQPWGLEGKAYTTYILENAEEIYLQSDPDMGFEGNYGRKLGLVWCNMGETGVTIQIKNSSDEVVRTEHLSGWILLNYHLILNGFSYNYYGTDSTLVFDNKYIVRWFQEAERFAATNGLGVHE